MYVMNKRINVYVYPSTHSVFVCTLCLETVQYSIFVECLKKLFVPIFVVITLL